VSDLERETIARAIYAVKPIRVTNRVEPLSFDEAASDGCWSEPEMSYKRADAVLALTPSSRREGL
jgi:hypothetical protein